MYNFKRSNFSLPVLKEAETKNSGAMIMETVITFAGASHAIQAEQFLLELGLPVKVMPTPSDVGAGCGFCLRLPPELARDALAKLAEGGIPHSATFIRRERDGRDAYEIFDAKS